LRLNRMDLPCSRCSLWLHAGGTEPREHLRPLALSRPAIPPSPLSDRVGYSDHDRFRGYIPVHFIPAYNLPVYASQRPLPDATQDSVRGCSLGFAAAVIADGRLQRACKAQRSSNRTGRFPASGSRTRPHAFACNAFCSFWTFIGVDRLPNLQVLHHVLRLS
jgi:hypothetical protein